MVVILIGIAAVVSLGGGAGYYGFSRYGGRGSDCVVGGMLIVMAATFVAGGMSFYHW